MAEGRNPLTDFPQELCPWLPLPLVPCGAGLLALTCGLSCRWECRQVQLPQDVCPGALWERMLWVEIVCLTFLDLIILFLLCVISWNELYQCGFQNHFNLIFSWKSLSQEPSVGKWLLLLCGFVFMASQFTDEEIEAVPFGEIYMYCKGSKCDMRLVLHVSHALGYLYPDTAMNIIISQGYFLLSWFRRN